ncbi:MAG: hypothetical protein CMJ19_21165 [Phycisphaeraceae bacterium]|nr:hypothetical protein [Phycisphaeraceae bacterium]
MDFILGMLLGLIFGRRNERNHIRSLEQREGILFPIVKLDNRKRIKDPQTVADAQMVIGQAVMASDYAKTFFARWRNIFGGEMKSFQSLLTRGRREALLRMIEDARRLGATEVWNVRFETSNISMATGRSGMAQVEIVAFGTAVRRAQPITQVLA